MKEAFGLVAACLAFVAYAPYLRDILNGKSKPHPYSWFIWGLGSIIIFALQISHGAGPGAYTTGTVALMRLIVCALSYKEGKKDIAKLDTICLVSALAAIVIWLFAKQPTLSMVLLVSIDMLGLGPSLRKAWNKPHGETLSMWLINGLRHALSLVALQKYTILTVVNPLAWAISNAIFSLILILRRRKLHAQPMTEAEVRALG